MKKQTRDIMKKHMRDRSFKTLHDLLCDLYSSYQACLAGNLEGEPNEFQERFLRLCTMNKLNYEEEWDKMECKHDH